MRSLQYTLAQCVSAVMYPMFMPTYGMILYVIALSRHQHLAPITIIVSILCTLLLTCIIPISIVLRMIRRGNVTDIYIRNPKERTMPYIYTIVAYGFWIYFCHFILHTHIFFTLAAIGATCAVALSLLINMRWKISAHLIGLGGLCGGIISYFYSIAQPALIPLIICSCIAWILMWARIYDHSHTPLQTACGYLLGMASTFIPQLFA